MSRGMPVDLLWLKAVMPGRQANRHSEIACAGEQVR